MVATADRGPGWYLAGRAPEQSAVRSGTMRAQKGQRSSTGRPDVGEWYRLYGASVYRRILRFYRAQEAEEVLQEVFLRVLRTADSYRGDSSPVTWLYSVATRHCLNRLRDARRRKELLTTHGQPGWSREVEDGDPDARVFLTQLWRELDSDLAMVGVLYFVDGMTHAQIAEVMGVSRRTVGNRVLELQRLARAAAGREEG